MRVTFAESGTYSVSCSDDLKGDRATMTFEVRNPAGGEGDPSGTAPVQGPGKFCLIFGFFGLLVVRLM